MRVARRVARVCGMKTVILAAVLLAIVPATASAGTIKGKLPRKGKPMTVRVVRMDSAEIVAAKQLKRPRYRIKVARGPYMVLASAGKRRFKSHAVRVGRKGTRRARLAAATDGPLATVAVDPNIKVAGVDGYPHGMPVDSLLITDLMGVDCSNGGTIDVVEVRQRDAIEREIELQNSKLVDPKTRITPHFTKPDTFITGHGEVSGDTVTLELTMRGRVNGSSTVTVSRNQILSITEAAGSDLKGQICRSQDELPAPPPPPARGPALGYRGSLSGSAAITSPAGVTYEQWSASDVRFSRTQPSSDDAPNYQISAGTLQFSVSGTVGGCTLSGSKAMPLAVDGGDAESTLDLAPDDSYFAVGFPNATLDVTYTCPDSDPFTMTYTAMNEFLRTNPGFQRRQPGPNGTVSGTATSTKGDTALKWTWALKPLI
jgi:hypothetical protein